jgi:hypothetical protein
MVGIEADSEEEALVKAQSEFDEWTLWDDTEALPLLLDEYEEVSFGRGLDFRIEQALPEGGVYPPPDASVLAIRRENAARQAAELLVAAYEAGADGGSIAWEDLDEAYAAALKAVGR